MRGERRTDDGRAKALRLKFKAYCRARNTLCHLCVARGDLEHAQIDYAAPRFIPNSFEADHKKSWEHYPHLRYEWNNLAASHSRCNRQRRDEVLSESDAPQQVWVKPDW